MCYIHVYLKCHTCNSRTRDALLTNDNVKYMEYNVEYKVSVCTVQNGATWVSLSFRQILITGSKCITHHNFIHLTDLHAAAEAGILYICCIEYTSLGP